MGVLGVIYKDGITKNKPTKSKKRNRKKKSYGIRNNLVLNRLNVYDNTNSNRDEENDSLKDLKENFEEEKIFQDEKFDIFTENNIEDQISKDETLVKGKSFDSNTYDQQKTELDALTAIFSDDITIINPLTSSCDCSFKIFIRPNQEDSSQNFSSIYLSVTYVPGYPQIPPIISLINAVNIHRDEVENISNKALIFVEEMASVSQCMIYDLCELIQREIMKYNIEPDLGKSLETSPIEIDGEKSELLSDIYGELQKRRNKQDEQILITKKSSIKSNHEIESSDPVFNDTISGFDYKRYFEEDICIGKGGGGSVYKAKNKIDGGIYAIKKIKLKGKKQAYIRSILKEVVLLSKLQHQNIVRYHNA